MGEKGAVVCGGGDDDYISIYSIPKEWSFCSKLKYIFKSLYLCNLMVCIFDISNYKTIWSDRIHSLKYLRSTTSGLEKQWSCQDLNSIGKMIFTNFQSRFLHRICGFMQQRLGMKKVISYKVKKRRCFHHSFSDKG